ncbi:MAG: hypothetical protein KDA37_13075 [Planctomycetales bacterium]|nr:hypothetical protein [Planctomycetales bacterium]
MLDYSNLSFDYELSRESFSHDDKPRRKDYMTNRANRPRRRSNRRRPNHPGCGIGARRIKRVAF